LILKNSLGSFGKKSLPINRGDQIGGFLRLLALFRHIYIRSSRALPGDRPGANLIGTSP